MVRNTHSLSLELNVVLSCPLSWQALHSPWNDSLSLQTMKDLGFGLPFSSVQTKKTQTNTTPQKTNQNPQQTRMQIMMDKYAQR